MNCEAVREMLWAYLEKETTAEETVKIEEHLKHCADCRDELELQKEMMETLAGLPDMELPEGYHAELMQKLQAEAAPNVVPFPQKAAQKKKQPMWKQWGMIAAAVLVVVAAGGMDGMLDMRKEQNAAVQEMKAADTAEPAAAPTNTMAVYDGIADVTEDRLEDVDTSEIAEQNSKQKNAPAAGAETITYTADDMAAVPEMAAATPTEEEMYLFSVTRSAEIEAIDKTILTVQDIAAAKTKLREAIAAVEGYEEETDGEDCIFAVIPAEAIAEFISEMESIGERLEWTQKGRLEEGAAYHTVEISLKTW